MHNFTAFARSVAHRAGPAPARWPVPAQATASATHARPLGILPWGFNISINGGRVVKSRRRKGQFRVAQNRRANRGCISANHGRAERIRLERNSVVERTSGRMGQNCVVPRRDALDDSIGCGLPRVDGTFVDSGDCCDGLRLVVVHGTGVANVGLDVGCSCLLELGKCRQHQQC